MSEDLTLGFVPLPGKTATRTTIKQPIVALLCYFRLPQEVREKTPRDIVKNCNGDFLLSFLAMPQVGEYFPYGNQIWKLNHIPIQQPTRYKSHQRKQPLVIFPDWICGFETQEDAMLMLLTFSKCTQ